MPSSAEPLAPGAQVVVDMAAAGPSLADLTIGQAREQIRALAGAFGAGDDVANAQDIRVPGADGDRRARVYSPRSARPLPVILYLHGGGWSVGDLETADALCRRLCARTGATVVALDYRLAPEHPFPAAVEDVLAATRWLSTSGRALGALGAGVVLAGDSAGGNLAAVVALRSRDLPDADVVAQVLLFPVVDLASDHPSMTVYADGYFATRRELDHWVDLYAGDRDPTDPALSPGRTPDVGGAPPALIVTAACDLTADAAEAYAWRLARAGVLTRTARYDGQIHDFILLGDLVDEADQATSEVARQIVALLTEARPDPEETR